MAPVNRRESPEPDLTFGSALERLADADADPDYRLVRMLSGPSRDELRHWSETWPSIKLARRRWIAGRLLETAEASFEVDYAVLFERLLEDSDHVVRSTAIDGLWEALDPELADRFLNLLERDAHPTVRARAAAALGRFVLLGELEEIDERISNRAVKVLVEIGSDSHEDPEVRRRATESAGYADKSDVRRLIQACAGSREREIRAGALRAMGNSADEGWGPAVMEALTDTHSELRFEAVRSAGELALDAAIPALYSLAETDDREIQFEAVWALGEIGGKAARSALERIAARAIDPELVRAIEDALAMVALGEGSIEFPELDTRDPNAEGGGIAGETRGLA